MAFFAPHFLQVRELAFGATLNESSEQPPRWPEACIRSRSAVTI
jgi:hypothetical protein